MTLLAAIVATFCAGWAWSGWLVRRSVRVRSRSVVKRSRCLACGDQSWGFVLCVECEQQETSTRKRRIAP